MARLISVIGTSGWVNWVGTCRRRGARGGSLLAVVAVAVGCGGAAEPPSEPKINPQTVPSLALLDGSSRRAEEISSSGAGETCEAVSNAAREHAREHGAGEEASEEHNEEIRSVLNDGKFLNACEVPSSAAVELCVAVVGGTAKGVTVFMKPGTVELADCVAEHIRRLAFPEHDLVSVARTQFDPQY